jgi:hypothetical protein
MFTLGTPEVGEQGLAVPVYDGEKLWAILIVRVGEYVSLQFLPPEQVPRDPEDRPIGFDRAMRPKR